MKLRAMGDTLLMAAAAQSMKKARLRQEATPRQAHVPQRNSSLPAPEVLRHAQEPGPDTKIHVLAPKAWAPLLQHHPDIARVWSFDTKANGLERFAQRMALIAELRAENFDAVVALHASPSTAWLAKLSGAPRRAVHFHGFTDRNLFSTVDIPGKGELKPILERDLDALRALWPSFTLKAEAPRVAVTENEKHAAHAWMSEHGLRTPCLAVGLGASRPTKVWPAEHFARLVSRWLARKSGSALLVCAPNEVPLAQRIVAGLTVAERSQVLIKSDATVRELAALLSVCDAFAGNDSGPKHLAVAVGLPTVTFFGPENPFEWHPYDRKRHRVLFVDDLACRTNVAPNGIRWCGIQECTVEKHRCMTEITPEAAYEELEKVLATF